MSYRFDTQHLTGQQKAIINERDKNDELLKRTHQEKKTKIEYKLSEKQLNFLTRLKKCGTQHYSILGDAFGDDVEAEKQLEEMDSEGYVTYLGGDATITKKGLEQVKGRENYIF